MVMGWDGVDRRSIDYGERVARLEANAHHESELVKDLQQQIKEIEEILVEIKGAIKFIKLIAGVATVGATLWGYILASLGTTIGNK
jgi:hypothetical protein